MHCLGEFSGVCNVMHGGSTYTSCSSSSSMQCSSYDFQGVWHLKKLSNIYGISALGVFDNNNVSAPQTLYTRKALVAPLAAIFAWVHCEAGQELCSVVHSRSTSGSSYITVTVAPIE